MALLLLTGTACGYSDRDKGIGELVNLQSLRQIEGVYNNNPVDNGEYWTSGPYATKLASKFGKYGLLWSEQILDATTMVAITFISEHELAISALDATGNVLIQRRYRQPEDFTFQSGQLKERIRASGNVGFVGVEKTSSPTISLNDEGNLVMKAKVINRGFILGVPVLNQKNLYTEYQRIR